MHPVCDPAPAATLVRINRKRCALLGAAQATIGLMMLMMTALIGWSVQAFDGLVLLSFVSAVLFCGLALFFFGLAWRAPVALRMDASGVSGYYLDPATWDEIKQVHSFSGYRRYRFLGFELRDPVTFRDRQSPWRRYLSWSNGRQNNAHLVIPQVVLRDADVDALAAQARAFQDQAKARPRRPGD